MLISDSYLQAYIGMCVYEETLSVAPLLTDGAPALPEFPIRYMSSVTCFHFFQLNSEMQETLLSSKDPVELATELAEAIANT